MAEDRYLEHYGRLGMKWYQHIYGDYQGQAKYAKDYKDKETAKIVSRDEKADKKYSKKYLKTKNEAKKQKIVNDWDKYKERSKKELDLIRSYTIDDILKEAGRVNVERGKFVITNMAAAGLGAFSGGAGFEYMIGAMLGGGVGSGIGVATSKNWGDLLRTLDRQKQIVAKESKKTSTDNQSKQGQAKLIEKQYNKRLQNAGSKSSVKVYPEKPSSAEYNKETDTMYTQGTGKNKYYIVEKNAKKK